MPAVLVVGARRAFRDHLRAVFQNYGCVVDCERRGSRALRRMRHAAEAGRAYAAVVFAERLAGNLRGLEAAARHRRWEREKRQRRRAVGDTRPPHLPDALHQQIAVFCSTPAAERKAAALSVEALARQTCTVRDLARLACDGDDDRIRTAFAKHAAYDHHLSRARVRRVGGPRRVDSFRRKLTQMGALANSGGTVTMPAIQEHTDLERTTMTDDTTPPPLMTKRPPLARSTSSSPRKTTFQEPVVAAPPSD